MNSCELRTAASLQAGKKVIVQGVTLENKAGQNLFLCQAMMSLLPELLQLKLPPILALVICGLMEYNEEICPIGCYYLGGRSADLREVFTEYRNTVFDWAREAWVRRMSQGVIS